MVTETAVAVVPVTVVCFLGSSGLGSSVRIRVLHQLTCSLWQSGPIKASALRDRHMKAARLTKKTKHPTLTKNIFWSDKTKIKIFASIVRPGMNGLCGCANWSLCQNLKKSEQTEENNN